MMARILIVEDESIVQLDLQSQLQKVGYAVVGLASAGEEAISKAMDLKPDLVLMDLTLIGPMDGIEAASKIKAAFEVPVVFLTANPGNLAERREVLVVSKPFRAADLQAAIVQALSLSDI